MEINKGKINNINKKLLAGLLTFALIPTVFAGCDYNSTGFVYEKNELGQYVCVENVEYSYLEDCVVIALELDGKESVSIARVAELIDLSNGRMFKKYYNIFGEQEIYSQADKNTNMKIIYEESLISYLVSYNKIQHEYTEEEMKEILKRIEIDYNLQKIKQLFKK